MAGKTAFFESTVSDAWCSLNIDRNINYTEIFMNCADWILPRVTMIQRYENIANNLKKLSYWMYPDVTILNENVPIIFHCLGFIFFSTKRITPKYFQANNLWRIWLSLPEFRAIFWVAYTMLRFKEYTV